MAGSQHRETDKSVSTSTASWRGPNTEKLVYQFLQALRVGAGPQQRETGKPVSTSTASWGDPIKAKPEAGT
ncbi:hypothetical protein [Staphylococcus marylandisciuri]|uniref:hypothetical protein n=1 Tax=Staphylococcus marylandisciuri TaxID=2981529 RepID=UPI0021D3D9EE|nr:hypothetical protein [Staphylococcus marylandisciuri]